MTILRVVDCLALSIAPYIIYYYATELSEYEALKSAGYGSLASVVTALVQGILTALYTPAGSSSVLLRAAVAAAISLTDVVGLWYALSKLPHRNISNSHKFQAVGVGWALVGAVMFHAAPILAGGFSAEFDTVLVLKAVEANILLARTLSMACVGAVLWSKKAKPAGLMPVLRLLIIAHAVVPAVLGVFGDMHAVVPRHILALNTAATWLLASGTYAVWQRCNAKVS